MIGLRATRYELLWIRKSHTIISIPVVQCLEVLQQVCHVVVLADQSGSPLSGIRHDASNCHGFDFPGVAELVEFLSVFHYLRRILTHVQTVRAKHNDDQIELLLLQELSQARLPSRSSDVGLIFLFPQPLGRETTTAARRHLHGITLCNQEALQSFPIRFLSWRAASKSPCITVTEAQDVPLWLWAHTGWRRNWWRRRRCGDWRS
mmetsp:Transcript_50647/g.134905  ORF Transcript_50647/g.134905 Transcript_50647/m.134905 type:complete len:205 (+) Transcript_50647:497-1111(+)